jgi:hypothetical protein
MTDLRKRVLFAHTPGASIVHQTFRRLIVAMILWLVVLLSSGGLAPLGLAGSPPAPPPLGQPGTVAHYVVRADLQQPTDYEREHQLSVVQARLELGEVVPVAGRADHQWYGLEFSRINGEQHRLWLLLDSWPTDEHDPHVAEYRWQESGWPDAIRFVHEVNGEAILPRLNLWTYGWPQRPEEGGGSRRAPAAELSETILFQGWLFDRISIAQQPVTPLPADVTTVKLNPDLIIGWVYNQYHDVDGRPDYRLESGTYEYIDKPLEEIVKDLEAGFNFFASRGKEPIYPPDLERRGIYHSNINSPVFFRQWPLPLYRPNYWGMRNHIDEPGVGNFGASRQEGPDAPPLHLQAVRSLQKGIRGGWETQGREAINRSFDKRVPAKGDMWLIEPQESIVSWEYEWPTAWYQLSLPDGVGGIVDEDAVSNDLVETYNMAFGTQIPPTVSNACAIRVGVLRGAARNFDKRWGVAVYFPNEVKLKSESLPYFYNRGASYFWLWIGYPPHPYKRYYADLMRQAFAQQPQRDMPALLRAAKVAVVIPYGYTFAPYNMHRIAWLPLEGVNEHGVTYREVLSRAATEVERLIRLGVDFDIAVDEPAFHGEGYEELIYAQADGQVRIERVGQPPQLLDAPRPLQRPDLGPAPTISLEVVADEKATPGKIRFKATATIGSGEWAGERAEPLIYWEIYNPDGTVTPSLFPEYGTERMLRVEDNVSYTMRHPIPDELMERSMRPTQSAGSYTVRVAVADIFGRPAVAYKTLYVEAPTGQ